MKRKKILILGGTGFLGKNLVKHLHQKAHTLTSFSRRIVPANERLEGVNYIFGDIGSSNQLEDAIKEHHHVVHFASASNPKTSEDDFAFDMKASLEGAINVFSLCAKYNVDKLLYCSSGGTIYGVPESLPIKENSNTTPISAYGLIKMTIENYIRYFSINHGLNYCILRLSNPYGPGQSPYGTQGVIPVFMKKILDRQQIQVFGNGTVVRDYIYIRDFCEACEKYLLSSRNNFTVNVGSGTGTSLNELIKEISRLTNTAPEIHYMQKRNFDVPENYLDVSLARDMLDWKPKTTLQEGLFQTLNWLQDKESYPRPNLKSVANLK